MCYDVQSKRVSLFEEKVHGRGIRQETWDTSVQESEVGLTSMNKEVMMTAKSSIEMFPILCDFDGKNLLLLNNFVDAKNKYRQKLSVLNLETRENIHVMEKVEKMRLGVLVTNGFVMVQEQSEIIFFNLMGRILRVMKARDEKGFFSPDRAVRFMMEDPPDLEKGKLNHGKFIPGRL